MKLAAARETKAPRFLFMAKHVRALPGSKVMELVLDAIEIAFRSPTLETDLEFRTVPLPCLRHLPSSLGLVQ